VLKIGDVIQTPRGPGTVRCIEEHLFERRYCVALHDPAAVNWPAGELCCYTRADLEAQFQCLGCPLFAKMYTGGWTCVAEDERCEYPHLQRIGSGLGRLLPAAHVEAAQLSLLD